MGGLGEVTRSGTELEQLRALHVRLAAEIDLCEDPKALSQLARQYRECARRIAELDVPEVDGVADVLEGLEHVR